MTSSRWWTIAVLATAVVLSALVVLEQAPLVNTIGAIACSAAIVVTWLVLGRRALCRNRYGIAITVLLVALASGAV